MFFVLSKILQYLAMPLLWIVALLLFSLISKKQPRKRKSLLAAVLLLLFFTNPFISNEVWLAWEPEAVLMKEVPKYDAGIVLTGVTEVNKAPYDRVHYSEGPERILEAIQLYKLGKIKKIIISGGSGALKDVARTEAENLQLTALLAAVPQKDILLDEQSRNTRENALKTKELLTKHPEIKSLLLITSAFHMRRAKGCFEQVGLNFDTFPVDFRTHNRSFYLDDLFIPSTEALSKWTNLIHEWLGYIVYKVLGYS
ncbi:YdcF family protein [Rufibacter roseus]|uniref:YdcF family protein n=1 Tax=Rufibacter roseus TaxID=1567108 RepID=A0ABW2DJY0_9BACT|nr:YdcF family protein [Rufibacter roseus]